MTVTDPRLWNPSGPHVGPDAEDLAFLQHVGEDPETSLGSVAIALHRVGAAACEQVMRAPLPDEYRMIEALAQAREQIAAPAVDKVSKALGDFAYSDLLLRDLFDDAEQGALSVYMACVAKAVAPPLAVQRAGLIYGVPKEDLGRYIAVATKSNLHPVALADASDRAVLAWASNLAREEANRAQVAKRSVQEYNRSPFGQEHPKGQAGRFVDLLERPSAVAQQPTVTETRGPLGFLARVRPSGFTGGTAAPLVAEAPVTVATEVVEPAPARVARGGRVSRKSRKTQSSEDVRAAVSARISAKQVRSHLKSKVSSILGTNLKAQIDKQVAAEAAAEFDDSWNLGKPHKSDGIYPNLPEDHMFAIAMSAGHAQALYDAAPGAENEKWLVLGNLLDIHHGRPELWNSESHSNQLKGYIEDTTPPEDVAAAPQSVRISRRELSEAGVDFEDPQAVARYAQENDYYDLLTIDEHGRSNPLLKKDMSVSPAANRSGDWYVVRKPEKMLHGDDDPPVPIAAELVLASDYGDIRGYAEGTKAHLEWHLDPSQHYVFKNRQLLWDEDKKGYVERYHLMPMDPDFVNKAVQVETVDQWNATVRGKTHPKDDRGRWATAPAQGFLARVRPRHAPEAVVSTVTPIERKSRTSRKSRAGAPKANLVQTNVSAQVRTSLPPAAATKLQAAMHAAIKAEQKDLPTTPLDDQVRYKVFTEGEWQQIIQNLGYHGFADPGVADRLALVGGAKRAIFERDTLDIYEADAELRVSVLDEVTSQKHPLFKVPTLTRAIGGPDEDREWLKFAHDIRNYMNQHPEVAYAQVEANPQGELEVYVNRNKVADRVIVIMPDDPDPDSQYVLRWIGYQPQSVLTRGLQHDAQQDLHIDAKVQTYKIARARTHMWQVEEQ